MKKLTYRLYTWVGGRPDVDLLQGTNSPAPIRRGGAIRFTDAQAAKMTRAGFVLEETPAAKTPAKPRSRATSSRRSRTTKPKAAETPAEEPVTDAAESAAE